MIVKVGVLAFQGAVSEIFNAVRLGGAEPVSVKKPNDLNSIEALILPGGESSAMRKLIDGVGMLQPLKDFVDSGKPVMGICAGMILLAREIEGELEPHIAKMDVSVKRNSFGRQVDSFETSLSIKGIGEGFPAVFIRAPHITGVGEEVEVLAKVEDRVVFARQNNLVGCSFHPELTEDTRIMFWFLSLIQTKE